MVLAREKIFWYWISAFVFAVPAFSLLANSKTYSLAAFFLLLGALYWLVKNIKKINITNFDLLVLTMFFSYPFYVLLSVIFSEAPLRELDRPLRFMFAFPIYLMLSRIKFPINEFFAGIIFSGIAVSCVIVYKTYNLGGLDIFLNNLIDSRFKVNIFVIVFGSISLLISLLSFIALWFFDSKLAKAIAFISFLGALFSVLFSGTRGSWIAMPLGIIVLGFLLIKFSIKQKLVLLTLAFLVLGSAFTLAYKSYYFISYKVDSVINAMEQYPKLLNQATIGEDSEYQYKSYKELESQNLSLSYISRLDMWRVSWENIKVKPLFGWGLGKSNEVLVSSKGKVKTVSDFIFKNSSPVHTHNNYLEMLLEIGIFGFVSFMWFFVAGIFIFCKMIANHYKNKLGILNTKTGVAMHAMAVSGLLILSSYLVFMLTEVMSHHESSMSFLAFMTAIIMGGYRSISTNKS